MKKLLSVILCAAMLMSSLSFCLPAVAIELDFGVESTESYVETADEAEVDLMSATYTKSNGEPGLNMLTGSFAALDFEGSVTADFWTGNAAAIAVKATASNANNQAMELSGQYAHFDITPQVLDRTTQNATNLANYGASIPAELERERPATLSFDYIAGHQIYYTNLAHNVGQYVFEKTYDYTTEWKTGYEVVVTGNDLYYNTTTVHQRLYIMNPMADYTYYFDNISLVPHYKVTYNYNGGTDANSATSTSVYTLPAVVNNARTLTPDSTIVPTKEGYKLVGWSTDANATAAMSGITLGTEDITIYAVWREDFSYTASNGEPGLNILTGTTAGFDYEKSLIEDFKNFDGDVSLATMATSENASNKALKIASASTNNYFDVTPYALNNSVQVADPSGNGPALPVYLEVDRPHTVSFDYIGQGDVRFVNTAYGLDDTSTRNYMIENITLASTEWAEYSTTFNGSEFSYDGTLAKTQRLFIARKAGTGNGDYYFDNLSIVPNYKVIYNYNNGTDGSEVKYVLPEAVNGVRTLTPDAEVVPTRDGYKFLGWATTAEATTATESFVLANADVTLYAVWQEAASYKSSNGEPGLNILTGTTAGIDFEKSTMADFVKFGSNVDLATMATTENASNKAMKIASSTSESGHFDVTPLVLNNEATVTAAKAATDGPSLPVILDTDRTYTVSFDYIAKGEIRFVNTAYGLNDNGDRNFMISNPQLNSEDWAKYSTNFKGSEFSYDGTTAKAQRLFIARMANYGTGDYYFDNISITPNYKVTYDYSNGTETTEVKYVLPEAVNGVRTLTPDAEVVPTRDGYKLLGWATSETATAATESFDLGNEDITLYAVWEETASYASSNGEPGLNILTGTVAGLDFEKSLMEDFVNLAGDVSITTMATSANAANKAVKIASSTENNYFDVTPIVLNNEATVTAAKALTDGPSLPVLLELERPYTVSFDYIAQGEIRFVNTAYGPQDSGSNNFLLLNPQLNSTEWAKYSHEFSGSEFSYNGTQAKAQRLFLTRMGGYGTGDYYFDNISITPNYKVTYDSNDGTGTTTSEYVLPEADAQGVRVFAPTATLKNVRGSKFLGWSTDPNATTAMSEITLGNEDITLYAVWETKYAAPGVNVLTGTTNAIDFENAETADFWTVSSEVTTMATEENESNKAMKMTYDSSVTNFFNLTPFANNWMTSESNNVNGSDGPTLPAAIEADRPVTINFNYIADDEFRLSNTAYGAQNSGTNTFVFHMGTIPTNGAWGEYSYTFSGANLYCKDTDVTQAILLTRWKEKGSADYYFDNIRVIPHYKVTYVHNDGTEDTTVVYALPSADKETGVRLYTPENTVTRDGYILKGWSTAEGATTAMSEVALGTEDITLYAVWEETVSTTLATASIRTKAPQGMRYAGYVSANLRNSANVEEYGYIVAAACFFENEDYTALKFNANGDKNGVLDDVDAKYKSAAAYTKGGRDYSELLTVEAAKEVFTTEGVLDGITDDGYYFSAAITEIPEEHYQDAVVGKTYVKIDGVYYYGEAVVRSLYDVAVEYDSKYDALGKETPEYITSVIDAVASTESN